MSVDDLQVEGVSEPVRIGQGGYGTVYRCREIDLDRPVAVKVLSGQLDEVGKNRFERERRAMGVLSGHPNIVMVHRSGLTEQGRPYIVMEYLAGGSIADKMSISGPLPWSTVLEIGIEICGALETAHRAGVLHRDIKPANLLESNLGVVKLGDFGIARMQGAPETRSAMITASIAHAAPEIIEGKRPDVSADVYSLGSTLFELLTGSPAFVRETDESIVPIISRVAQDPVPDLRPLGVPDLVCRALESAMAKDPHARPSSAEAFGRTLQVTQRSFGLAETPLRIEGERTVDLVGQPSPPTQQPTPPTQQPTPFNLPPPPPVSGAGPPVGQPISGAVAAKRSKAWLWVTLAVLGFFAMGTLVVVVLANAPDTIEVGRLPVTTDSSISTGPASTLASPEPADPGTATTAGGGLTTPTAAGPEVLVPTTVETPQINSPPTVATAPEAVLPERPTVDGDIVFAGDYDAYVEISDDKGLIRFEVPADWSDVDATEDAVHASTDLSGLVSSYGSSGVNVQSTVLPLQLSPDVVLDQLPLAGCARVDNRADAALAGMTGRSVRVSGCGPTGQTEVTYLAVLSDDDLVLMVIALQATDPRDGAAFERILETFRVKWTG